MGLRMNQAGRPGLHENQTPPDGALPGASGESAIDAPAPQTPAPLETAAASPDSGEEAMPGMDKAAGGEDAKNGSRDGAPEELEIDGQQLPAATEEVAAVTGQDDASGVAGGVSQTILLAGAALFALGAVLTVLAARRMKKARALSKSARTPASAPGGPQRLTGISVGNAHNLGRRDNQEDAFGVSELSNAAVVRAQGVMAVVADGMGGLNNGELISAAVTSTVLREFPAAPESWLPCQRMLFLAEQANAAANKLTGGQPAQSGSTLLIANILSGALNYVSVGDSRICLVRGGALIQLTREHVYAADLDWDGARGHISFDAASADRQRHALTSYIGMGPLTHIDFNPRPIKLLPGDWVILMSDGVFNALTDEEIAACLTGNVHQAASRLEQAVLAKNDPYQDNFTAVLMQLI